MKKILYILALPLALGFASCETVVDIDLPEHKPLLVVNALLSPDSTFEVTVSHSISILDNGTINRIQNAVVDLYKDGVLLESLVHNGDGVYISSVGTKPEAGHQYTVKVAAANYTSVEGIAVIPVAKPIVSASIADSVSSGFGSFQSELSITFNDPPGAGDFYLVELLAKDSLYYNPIFMYPSTEESSSKESVGAGIIMSDELFDGKAYTLNALFDSYYTAYLDSFSTGEIIVKLKSVSRDYYLYTKTRNLQMETQGNPFSEPVQVHTNITNGFGIFAGYSSDTLKLR